MHTKVTPDDVKTICLWMYATPVLFSWALLSFLPVFGIFVEGASVLSIAGDVVFFATGAVALIGLFVIASFSAKPEQKSTVNSALRGKVGVLAAYATVWLVAYWAFKFYVV